MHARIRSNTDCCLESARRARSIAGRRWNAGAVPGGFARLPVPTGAADHAVVASPDYYGPDAEDFYDPDGNWNITTRDPRALVFSAESFEAFLCRFWIENELWFSAYANTAMSEVCRQYLELYRRAPADPLRGRPPAS